eukprot:gene8947-biopygen6449
MEVTEYTWEWGWGTISPIPRRHPPPLPPLRGRWYREITLRCYSGLLGNGCLHGLDLVLLGVHHRPGQGAAPRYQAREGRHRRGRGAAPQQAPALQPLRRLQNTSRRYRSGGSGGAGDVRVVVRRGEEQSRAALEELAAGEGRARCQ